jgi:hypothetical protein
MNYDDKISDKIDVLQKKGYKFVFDRDIFCNNKDRKCFSLEFIEDNPIDVIESKLREPVEEDIKFYFNEFPSENVRLELAREIEGLS